MRKNVVWDYPNKNNTMGSRLACDVLSSNGYPHLLFHVDPVLSLAVFFSDYFMKQFFVPTD